MAKGRGQKVNRTELAAIFGVSMPTVDAWVRAGCPFDQRGQGVGRAWVFDTSDVARWRENRAREEATGDAPVEEAALKRRRMLADTMTAEMEMLERKKLLAPVEQMERNLARALAEVSVNMRSLPARVVSQLIGETDEGTFKRTLLAEIDQVLESLADMDLTAEEPASPDAGDDD